MTVFNLTDKPLNKAAAVLSFAEPDNIESVRRLLYNRSGVMNEQFVLVEVSGLLYAGFQHTLQRIQEQYVGEDDLAFLSTVAPSIESSRDSSPPSYSEDADFAFQLDCLRKTDPLQEDIPYTLRLRDMLEKGQFFEKSINDICELTALDRGQAMALCGSLSRGLALTQGMSF